MKEIMDEVKLRFGLAVHQLSEEDLTPKKIVALYEEISSEVYLEKLSQLMERKS